MSATRRIIVGVVAMLSLLGTAGAVTAATPDSEASVSSAPVVNSTRWCC